MKRTIRLGTRAWWTGLAAAALLAAAPLVPATVHAADPVWEPAAWTDLSTLRILTVGSEEGEHWSTLWLVVIDGGVYLRLGSRAAERVQGNAENPYVAVEIDGQRFDHVRIEDAAAMRDDVARAMGEKYWSDLLIRFFPHPMTVQLVPGTEDAGRPEAAP